MRGCQFAPRSPQAWQRRRMRRYWRSLERRGAVVYAWTWGADEPQHSRGCPRRRASLERVVREELPRNVRSCVGGIRFGSTPKSLRVVRFRNVARGEKQTTCRHIPFVEGLRQRTHRPPRDSSLHGIQHTNIPLHTTRTTWYATWSMACTAHRAAWRTT